MTTGTRVGASTNEVRLAMIAETAWGTTPTSPTFDTVRLTSESLQPNKETVDSSEIRADRNLSETMMVGQGAEGSIDFEWSYGTFDDLLAAALFSNWSTDELVNGVTPTSFTIERTTPVGAGNSYDRFLGMIPNTLSLSVTARQIVTGSAAFIGRQMEVDNTIIVGATYNDATQARIMTAATSVGLLSVGGLSPTPRIRSLTLEINNNLRTQDEIGNLYNAGVAPGDFLVSGTLEAYFTSGSLAQAYLDHDDVSLEFTLGEDSGSRYRILVPTVKLTGDLGKNASGKDADVVLSLSWQANLDRTSPGIGGTLLVERGY